MINTKCQECMFSSDANNPNACSKNIIEQIQSIKTITRDSDNYNVIENYACRYGFSKHIYEQHKNEWDTEYFNNRLLENSEIRYYLLLDCVHPVVNFTSIIDKVSKLSLSPKAVSFMFRHTAYRPFNNDHKNFLVSNYNDIDWKVHNFVEDIELENGIDHILSTNAKNNNTSIFLVYNSTDLDSIELDIQTINNHMILYQSPMIAIVDKNKELYRLAMSFENYKVAKSLGPSLISVLEQESSVIYY